MRVSTPFAVLLLVTAAVCGLAIGAVWGGAVVVVNW